MLTVFERSQQAALTDTVVSVLLFWAGVAWRHVELIVSVLGLSGLLKQLAMGHTSSWLGNT